MAILFENDVKIMNFNDFNWYLMVMYAVVWMFVSFQTIYYVCFSVYIFVI